MARYVIANRRAGRFGPRAQTVSRREVAVTLSSFAPRQILHDFAPEDPLARRVAVIDADPSEMAAKMAALPPDVIIEPEILHWPDVVPPPQFRPRRREAFAALASADLGQAIVVTVLGGGRALPNAAVQLYVRQSGEYTQLNGMTDADGTCTFRIAAGDAAGGAIVTPAGGFWTMLVGADSVQNPIDCPALPSDGPLGWWHRAIGLNAADSARGAGVKVGVADTGIGPHPSLGHVVLVGTFVGGKVLAPSDARDVGSHGTHVCGTIGARPAGAQEYAGVAPGCDLFAARIYSGPDAGASSADIVNSIDALSRTHRVDLINLSLGTTTPSKIVHDALVDAAERGTLCVCAAGNDSAAVNYPAAFPEALAVAALGRAGWGPPGTLSAARAPTETNLFGQNDLYAANFTSHGPEVRCVGPGVGIVAPVPNHFGTEPLQASMDGTSMASPVTCGALAVLLAQDRAYQALPRDLSRTAAARNLLGSVLRHVGLPPFYEGNGLPILGQAAIS